MDLASAHLNQAAWPTGSRSKHFANPFGLALHTVKMAGSRFDQLQLLARGRQRRHHLPDVRVGHLVGDEFGAVAEQVDHLKHIGVLSQPRLEPLA